MSFTATCFPLEELQLRHKKCQGLLAKHLPEASGILVFSRTNIYYLSGTRANGLLWLPREGEPVLMVRKALERCRLESPLKHITSFKSYTNIPNICDEFKAALKGVVGAEMRGLPWSLAQMLESRLNDYTFEAADLILDHARCVKSPYEIERIRHAAKQHTSALFEHLPKAIKQGMNEQDIAKELWKIYFSLGHGGMLRKQEFGAEIFLGGIAIGDNSLLPPAFAGSTSYLGEHPSMPHMGYAGRILKKNDLLNIDTGFMWEGYHSDMAVSYAAGKRNDIPKSVHNAYKICHDTLKNIEQKISSALPAQSGELKQIIQNTQHHLQTQHPKASVIIHSHGVGLSMDESLNDINIENIDSSSSLIFTIHPCISIENLGTVGIKALYAYSASGLECLTEHPQELLCL